MAENMGEPSKSQAQPSSLGQDKATKCRECLLRRRRCDQAKPKCGTCQKYGADCAPQDTPRPSRPRPQGAQDPWRKCQACRESGIKCVYKGTSLGCTACDEQKQKCVDQVRPVWRSIRRRNAQPPENKCRACFDNRSLCDGKKPACGNCKKYRHRCVPRGTARVPPIPLKDKCRRCRQQKSACTQTRPCDYCLIKGIICGYSLNEEAEARRLNAEDEGAGRPEEIVRGVLEEDVNPHIDIINGVNENGITEHFNNEERSRDSEEDFGVQPEVEMFDVGEEGGLFVDSENEEIDIRITTRNKGKGKEIIPQPRVEAASSGSKNDYGHERFRKPSMSEVIANTDDDCYQIPQELGGFDLNAMIRDRLRVYRLSKSKGTQAAN